MATIDEDIYKKLLDELSTISKDIDKIVIEIKNTTSTSSIYFTNLNKKIEKQYERLRKVTTKWVNSNILPEYKQYLNEQLTKLKYTQLPLMQKMQYDAFTKSGLYEQDVDKVIKDTLQSYYGGYSKGEKTLKKLANYTQIINVSEKQIREQIAEGIIEKGSAQAAASRLRKKLLEKAIDGKYITIIDIKGRERNYNVKSYAELVTRTKIQEVNWQAVSNTASALNADLVQVDASNSTCKICAPIEGKIYSISGNSRYFPKLTFTLPLHPNCRHSMTIVFEEGLKADGTLEKYSDFSLGITENHPTRRSFIPVEDRKLK